ncbi:MAG: hypothetical protein ACF8LK_05320 [Phycisphaerales bacterium JB041]
MRHALQWRWPFAILTALGSGVVALGGVGPPHSEPDPGTSGPTSASRINRDDFEPVTEESREAIADRIAALAPERVLSHETMPAERAAALEEAVAATLGALLGSPDRLVAYQQRHKATLNGDRIRDWVHQLHGWKMLESVSGDEADDVRLYAECVAHPEERFAALDAVAVAKAEFAVDLNVKLGSPEWPFDIDVWAVTLWKPGNGAIHQKEGEEIADGASGRTASVAVPVRSSHLGVGTLRAEFYWNPELEYWVPHMARIGLSEDAGGETAPMLLF